MSAEVNQAVAGYMLGNLMTSLIAGIVVFVTLTVLGVPYPLLWGLWVALVDFLPMIGGALAGIPTALFAFTHSLTAGIVTAVVFIAYPQIENHILNPVIMCKTVKISPLLVLVAVLVGARSAAWSAGCSAASWPPCWPSRSPGRCRSSSGRCGMPPPRPGTRNRRREAELEDPVNAPENSSQSRPIRGSMALRPPHRSRRTR